MNNKNGMKRKSGILLHISSLPGKSGIGTMGKQAYKFIEFLKKTKQTLWQVLPMGHTSFGNSPYSAYSAYAGNPLLIDISEFQTEKESTQIEKTKIPGKVNFEDVIKTKIPLLKNIVSRLLEEVQNEDFEKFMYENSFWLDDYAFFMALKDLNHQKPFYEFEEKIRLRESNYLDEMAEKLHFEIKIWKYIQFIFFKQWFKLKKYANDSGIEIIGDMPLYVSKDSVDLWANPEVFLLDENKNPSKVAGVPPDYFSQTGQLWGNPVYDWDKLKANNYKWWIDRIRFNSLMYDIVRIDHFRGLSEFWAVNPDAETAENGQWLPAHGEEMFDELFKHISSVKIIAEDLGVITPDVEHLRDKYNFPGMKILQFAFESGEPNDFLPHRYETNSVVYTGTHDNDTTNGWLKPLNETGKKFLSRYTGISKPTGKSLIYLAWSSRSDYAIIPMQDFLNLDSNSRMNIPGNPENNWEWRFKFSQIKKKDIEFLTQITETFERG